MLHQQLKEELKDAMRAKDATRLTVLRGLLTAFTNENVAKKRRPDEMLPDEDALSVIMRASKQRKDSIEQFTKGGREDLAQKEKEELAIIETYLPKQMSEEEIRSHAQAKKEELGISDASKKNMLMGIVMKDLKGKADGTLVRSAVDSLFKPI